MTVAIDVDPDEVGDLPALGSVALDGDRRAQTPSLRIERIGLGYRSALDCGLELRLDSIRGSRDVTGQLAVRWLRPARSSRHLFVGNFDISRPSARTTMAKELGRLDSLGVDEWRGALEEFCIGVLSDRRQAPKVIDLASLGQRPSSRTLVGPALPIGHITTLMGKEGEGKTTLARAIALSVRTGFEVIPGWRPSVTGRVLVLDYESDEYEWAEGIAALAAGIGIEPPTIDYMACAWQGALVDHIEAIAAKVAEIKPVLVIPDSAELAAGAGQENDSFEARTQRLYAALKLLGTTTMPIDHLASVERNGEGPASKAYGSVFKMAWSRQVWELKREKAPTEDRAELLLINTKYNAGAKAKPMGLAFNYAPGRLTIERTDVAAPELQASLSVPERMTRLLRNGSLTVEAIADSLDKTPGYVRQMVSRYKDRFIRLPDQRIGLVSHS